MEQTQVTTIKKKKNNLEMGETLISRIVSLLGLKNQFSFKNHKAYKGNKKVWPIQGKK